MTKNTFNRVCIAKLKEISPEAYRECHRLTTPRITDLKHINEIIKFVESQGYQRNSIDSAIFIGTIYALFTPYKLFHQNIRLPIGLRDLICKEMKFNNPELINYFANILPTYTKGRWLKKIENLAENYINQIEDEKF